MRFLPSALFAVFVLWAGSAYAAVDIFLCSGNDEIKGQSQDRDYRGCVDVLAWSHGVSQSGTFHLGGGGGAGKANIEDLSITKWANVSSVDFLMHAIQGKAIPEMTLYVRNAGDRLLQVTIEMTNTLVTSVSSGGSGGEDRFTENVTLNTQRYCWIYGDGSPQAKFCWDVANNITF